MSKSKLGKNPFKPGPATKPGYLAGRDSELSVIAKALDEITEPQDETTGLLKETPLAPIKIVGPRGVGKTTLLLEAQDYAKAKNLTVVKVTEMRDLHPKSELCSKLADVLWGESFWRKAQKQLDRVKDFKAGPVGVSITEGQRYDLRNLMDQFLKKQPLVLLLDEAMEYDAEALGSTLRICQQMIGDKYPLALLLAGTPKLDQKLAKTKASFIGRTDNLYLNTLSPEATRDALLKPFEEREVKVQKDALELMAGMTDDYPYFTQIVGAGVWDAMDEAEREEADGEIVRRAEARIQKKRDEFYEFVYGNMFSPETMQHARTVMEILNERGGRTTRARIVNGLAAGLGENGQSQAMEIFHQLVDLGFIWSNGRRMEAGIPSFFSYCEAVEQEDAD